MASITETETGGGGLAGLASASSRRWLWLAIGVAAALLSTGGRWDVSLAAWVAPVLLLRFSRTSRPAIATVGVIAVSALQIAGYMVETAAPFNAMTTALCLALGAVFAVPYLLDRLLGGRLGDLGRVFLLPAAAALTEFAVASLLPWGPASASRPSPRARTWR